MTTTFVAGEAFSLLLQLRYLQKGKGYICFISNYEN